MNLVEKIDLVKTLLIEIKQEFETESKNDLFENWFQRQIFTQSDTLKTILYNDFGFNLPKSQEDNYRLIEIAKKIVEKI